MRLQARVLLRLQVRGLMRPQAGMLTRLQARVTGERGALEGYAARNKRTNQPRSDRRPTRTSAGCRRALLEAAFVADWQVEYAVGYTDTYAPAGEYCARPSRTCRPEGCCTRDDSQLGRS